MKPLELRLVSSLIFFVLDLYEALPQWQFFAEQVWFPEGWQRRWVLSEEVDTEGLTHQAAKRRAGPWGISDRPPAGDTGYKHVKMSRAVHWQYSLLFENDCSMSSCFMLTHQMGVRVLKTTKCNNQVRTCFWTKQIWHNREHMDDKNAITHWPGVDKRCISSSIYCTSTKPKHMYMRWALPSYWCWWHFRASLCSINCEVKQGKRVPNHTQFSCQSCLSSYF